MHIKAFSCLRPSPEHISQALSSNYGSVNERSQALADKVLELDISRALYLAAYSDGTQTWHALFACIDTTPNSEALESYQTVPHRIVYESNIAIDTILSAATAAVPLYNVQNGVQQLVVWRISRPEAVEALQAAFESIDEPTLSVPYSTTLVELVTDKNMPALPSGLFAHRTR